MSDGKTSDHVSKKIFRSWMPEFLNKPISDRNNLAHDSGNVFSGPCRPSHQLMIVEISFQPM